MGFGAQRDPLTIPPSGVPRRGHSVVSATSAEWNNYSARTSSSVDQGHTAGFLEPGGPVFENDDVQSDFGLEQENQPPIEVLSTPPAEPTNRRTQRQPLKQLNLDRNGRLLHTTSIVAEQSQPYPGPLFATPSQIDEDEDCDAESNASTIVLPATRKRSASPFEDNEEGENGSIEHLTSRLRPMKRLKTLNQQAADGISNFQPTFLNTTGGSKTLVTAPTISPSDYGMDNGSDSESIASTILPPPRKRGADLMEEDETSDGDDGAIERSPRQNMRKRQRASCTMKISSQGLDLEEAGSQQQSRHMTSGRIPFEGRRNQSMPAIGRRKARSDLNACGSFANEYLVHSTTARPRPTQNSLVEVNNISQFANTKLSTPRFWLPSDDTEGTIAPSTSPTSAGGRIAAQDASRIITSSVKALQKSFSMLTPAKTPILDSFQEPFLQSSVNPVQDVLGRLEVAEDRFTHWLTEVRNKKARYRCLMAQHQENQQALEDDIGRLKQLEDVIQTMATKELHEIDETIVAQEQRANKMGEQRKGVQQRLRSFEKFKHDFEKELRTRL